jgi:hypothetical protein
MVAKYLGMCLTSAYVIESCGAVLAPSAHSRFPSAFLVCRLTVVNGYTRAAHARLFSNVSDGFSDFWASWWAYSTVAAQDLYRVVEPACRIRIASYRRESRFEAVDNKSVASSSSRNTRT